MREAVLATVEAVLGAPYPTLDATVEVHFDLFKEAIPQFRLKQRVFCLRGVHLAYLRQSERSQYCFQGNPNGAPKRRRRGSRQDLTCFRYRSILVPMGNLSQLRRTRLQYWNVLSLSYLHR
jgi:hypothetical protein